MKENGLNIVLDQRSAVPLYEQICQQIRQKIESQELEVGVPLPTNHEFCKLLQVSYTTAHQAMALLAKEGYVTRQARRGTVVKGIPRRGVVGIYSWVELLEHGTKHEYYRMITRYLSRGLEEQAHVYRMYLGSESPTTRNLACEDLIRHVESGALCGVALTLAFPKMDELMKAAEKAHTPVVCMTGEPQSSYSVSMNLWGMGHQAADFLCQQGRKRVGVIFNGQSNTLTNHGRYAEILQDRGLPVRESWIIPAAPTEMGGYEAAGQLPVSELDGLIIMDDVIAMGVDRRLKEMGVNVPRDLMVCTFWNHGTRFHLSLPFERFEFDVKGQAKSIIGLLQDAISGQRISEPHRVVDPTHHMKRDTAMV
ncbi:MAG: GntR family transcriptional regulator [Phycisphaerales bacterium]|nr:GntR family transcriptional regulator [Phycisphaerales bacterium]